MTFSLRTCFPCSIECNRFRLVTQLVGLTRLLVRSDCLETVGYTVRDVPVNVQKVVRFIGGSACGVTASLRKPMNVRVLLASTPLRMHGNACACVAI